MFVGRHAIEVGWGDCDPARIVFFPRYFEWFEICTTALFRGAGLPLHAMFAERNMVGIPLLDVGARFHFGSGYGHVLEVESRIVEWKAKTFRVEHRFFRDGGLAVEGHEVRVWAVPIRPARSRCGRRRSRPTSSRASWTKGWRAHDRADPSPAVRPAPSRDRGARRARDRAPRPGREAQRRQRRP